MADRPRVVAYARQECDEIRYGTEVVASHGLTVDIRVEFALHDHERALHVLKVAYEEVLAQIAETEV